VQQHPLDGIIHEGFSRPGDQSAAGTPTPRA
jgi:hypothetical protein